MNQQQKEQLQQLQQLQHLTVKKQQHRMKAVAALGPGLTTTTTTTLTTTAPLMMFVKSSRSNNSNINNSLILRREAFSFGALPPSLTSLPNSFSADGKPLRERTRTRSSILCPALDELLSHLSSNNKSNKVVDANANAGAYEQSCQQSVLAELTPSISSASLATTFSSVPSTSSLLSARSSATTTCRKSKHDVRFDFEFVQPPKSDNDDGSGLLLQQHQRPSKRRRFERRNSFVVRDIAELSRIAEQSSA
mmetsp:Transcript_18141/g.39549  ORF Transcript_18141/g.39549 Transcript_18141/m.39549 type:complete len:250 (-) Transcript_18141:197-946(-)|eukprot:CAMPEP_0168192152 /NCGR_PEP_ID=MMETSP0139_2-20121125/17894_1 /TAXON_ID=44445 /ORGANISM="Pseudo-nitzschia australis, Strain 10249 10 AB" /LENGTH=249 /DNA_ID=CAMNT_0008115369 /DNA_START=101 /DNA_END=850 /DNA_ORIENTATION=+